MTSKILINPESLSQSYIPENLLHRDEESSQLSTTIGTVNTFVYGANGSGKTLLTKRVIENYNTTKNGRAVYIEQLKRS